MTGDEKQALGIVRQLSAVPSGSQGGSSGKAVDAETVAAAMGLSVYYVRDLCRSLVQQQLLTGSSEGYRPFSESSEGKDHHREEMESVTEEGELPGEKRVYAEGERIGEIKHKANPPSAEEVESTLRSTPWKTYEQVVAELTVHTLTCPAKGKEVSWHFCSTCPHQQGIDLKKWTVQCHYEFDEEELLIKKEESFSSVSCPIVKGDLSIPECEKCRYHRGVIGDANPANKRARGWIICGFPHTIEFKTYEEGREVEYQGKKIRIVPIRWE